MFNNRLLQVVFLILLISGPVSAKELILRLVDETTMLPISGCSVIVKGNCIGISNANGDYVVPLSLRKTIVTVSHIAYVEKTIDLNVLPDETVTVLLRVVNYNVNDVVVTTKKKKVKILQAGITDKHYYKGYLGYSINESVASYIPNRRSKDSLLLQRVYVYILGRGNYTAPFLMSIFKGEQPYIKPDDANRLFGPILCQASHGDDYYSVTVSGGEIPFPRGGVFVVLEAAENKKVTYELIKLGNLNIREDISSAKVGMAWQETNKFFSWHYDVKGWRRDTIYWENYPKNTVVQHGNPMIYIDLKLVR